jgi:peptidoglycan lytic transglycosylase D
LRARAHRRRRIVWWLGSAAIALALTATLPTASGAASKPQFPRPSSIEPNVDFWVNVFTTYSVRDFILHDRDNVWRIYEVLHMPGEGQPTREEIDWANAYLRAKYTDILNRLGSGAQPIGADERAVAKMFDGQPLSAYRLAADNLRVQEGLRERFREGLVRSRYYRSTMERIFRDFGLPPELVTLAQIESGFHSRARSGAGAAGIWQFTRATGRKYMHISRYRDDRLNPIRSTEAAAKLLSNNYEALGNWPLAITAYNYGIAGTVRASEEYDGNFSRVIRNYDGPRFGFAVKNYYAEFLAALQVHRYEDKYFPGIESDVEQVESSHNYTVHRGDTPGAIANMFGVSTHALLAANGLRDARHLRIGATLIIPGSGDYRHRDERHLRSASAGGDRSRREARTNTRHTSTQIAQSVASHKHSTTRASAKVETAQAAEKTAKPRHYTMRRGDTIYDIARRHNVPVRALLKANKIRHPRELRAGTRLIIPEV